MLLRRDPISAALAAGGFKYVLKAELLVEGPVNTICYTVENTAPAEGASGGAITSLDIGLSDLPKLDDAPEVPGLVLPECPAEGDCYEFPVLIPDETPHPAVRLHFDPPIAAGTSRKLCVTFHGDSLQAAPVPFRLHAGEAVLGEGHLLWGAQRTPAPPRGAAWPMVEVEVSF